MNRRTILQLTGASVVTKVGAAQVARSQDDDGDGGNKEAPACQPNIHFGNQELIIDASDYSDDAWAVIGVENKGDKASGEMKVTAEWLDKDGNLLETNNAYLPTLGAGETWRAYIHAFPDSDAIDDFAATGDFRNNNPLAPRGLTITESNIVDSDSGRKITGVVENTRDADLERIEAHGKFYDENGTVIEGNSAYQRNLPAGTNWSFEIGRGFMPAQAPKPTNHDVLLEGHPLQIQG